MKPLGALHRLRFPALPYRAAIIVGLALVLPSATAKFAPREAREVAGTEALLQKAIEEITRQRFDTALVHIDSLLKLQPNFRLAHLIRGDLLLARVKPISSMGSAPGASGERVEDLREEAIARLRALKERPSDERVPRYLTQMAPEQKYAVVVDTSRSRLYFYRNEDGKPRLVTDYYVSSGKAGALKQREGDQKTPIGVYHVTSMLPRAKLTDFYGSGAFPISYPNEWDKRVGRNGHGIWLHGTPSNTYSRPPRASDGCVVLSNTDLEAMGTNLQVGLTPVIISQDVQWTSASELNSERKDFLAALDRWRADWESRDTERYLSNYSRKFTSAGETYDSWMRQKRRVNEGKSWVKVQLANVSAFRDPGEKAMMVVTFDQQYQSSNLSNTMKKRQYWVNEDGRWRIIYEGSA
jgi:murein L,D-transpeptidase YafK